MIPAGGDMRFRCSIHHVLLLRHSRLNPNDTGDDISAFLGQEAKLLAGSWTSFVGQECAAGPRVLFNLPRTCILSESLGVDVSDHSS